MHDRLLAQALRKGWLWVFSSAFICGLAPGLIFGLTISPLGGMVVGLLLVSLGLFSWAIPNPSAPALRQLKVPVLAAHSAVVEVVAGISIALGQNPPDVVVVEHESLNVGVVDNNGRRTLAVTTGLQTALTRLEFESVCASQLAVDANTSLRSR